MPALGRENADAILQDDDLIGNLEHLFEAMGDVENSGTRSLSAARIFAKSSSVSRARKDRRRLVEDEYSRHD